MSPESKRTEELLHHAKALRAMARALIGNRSEAEDLVQDTLVLALESPPAWGDGIGGWLRGVLRQKVRHRHRAEASRARRETESAKQEALPPTVDIVARRAQLATLVEEVLHLREPYQTVLYLRFFEEKGPGEIARELSVPEGTVASQVSRGLELLRIRLDARAGGNRDAWVGALLPWFASETAKSAIPIGGAAMAGSMKLVGSAVVLGSLLFYINQTEDSSQEAPGLTPEEGSLTNEWSAPTRHNLPVQERVAVQPERETLLAVSEPETEPLQAMDAAPARESKPIETHSNPTDTGWVVGPVTRGSSMRTLTSSGIKRFFELEVSSSKSSGSPTPMFEKDGDMWINVDYSYRQKLAFMDRYESRIVGPFSTFERAIKGDWDLSTPDIEANLEDPPTTLDQGSSVFEKRIQVFQKHETEDRLVPTFKKPRPTDKASWFDGIKPDLDMPSLRPPENMAAGIEWTAPITTLGSLILPGGNLQVQFEDSELNLALVPTESDDSPDLVRQEWEAAECKLESLGIDRTNKHASLLFTIAISISGPLPEDPDSKESSQNEILGSVDYSVELDLTGTGRWDLVNQRLAELELDGELLIAFTGGKGGPELPQGISAIKSSTNVQFEMRTEDLPEVSTKSQDN